MNIRIINSNVTFETLKKTLVFEDTQTLVAGFSNFGRKPINGFSQGDNIIVSLTSDTPNDITTTIGTTHHLAFRLYTESGNMEEYVNPTSETVFNDVTGNPTDFTIAETQNRVFADNITFNIKVYKLEL